MMSTEESTSGGDRTRTRAGISVRPLEQGDFFAWYELFAGYAEFYGAPLSDERVMRAWAWLQGDASALRGLVAIDREGKVVGLVHVQEFERLLENDRGLYIEDLFVAPAARGKGVAKALIDHVKGEARDRGFGVIRWNLLEDNETAAGISEAIGERTRLLTYDLKLG
jgi:GNAT superfamily N-acetyltransferase